MSQPWEALMFCLPVNFDGVLGSARFHGERSALVNRFESLILGNLGQSRAVPGNWGTDSGTRLGGGET
ncbi:hypothetical protein FOVSG1_008030 [Fusarium oxysporum f. sp. vasinfectum]